MNYDILFLRRPAINYVSPPICELIFSATGGPVIFTGEVFTKERIRNLVIGQQAGQLIITITWDPVPDALCYTIYHSDSVDGSYVILEECIPADDCEPQPCFVIPKAGCYRVSAITPEEGETELSDPVCTSSLPPYVETNPATNIV